MMDTGSNIEKHFVMAIILLNIINVLGFGAGRLTYKKSNNTKFISRLTLYLGIFFLVYTFYLITWASDLISKGQILVGALIFLLSAIPFIIGKLAIYKKADFFINLQITALSLNMVIITSYYWIKFL